LGVPSDNISIIKSASMKDGMQEAWDEGVVAGFVRQAVLKYQITDLYTFDGYGVSGHPNHIATYNGVREAVGRGTWYFPVTAFSRRLIVTNRSLFPLDSTMQGSWEQAQWDRRGN
jgi:LmbE family N-acetylglucosaminyl deacetylase